MHDGLHDCTIKLVVIHAVHAQSTRGFVDYAN